MNKKIVVIVVIVECILAILLISVLGKAIETYFTEIECQEIYFVDETGARIDKPVEIELTDRRREYQLIWAMSPSDTSDKAVVFTSNKPDSVEVDESGNVNFFDDTDVVITVSTKNGKTASITLVPKRNMDSGDIGPLE